MAGKRNAAQLAGGRPPAPAKRLAAVAGAESARTALDLDRGIHERVRLAIVSALVVNDTLTFNELKRFLGATDGNLSVHARELGEAGYIGWQKTVEGRGPKN